MDRLSQPNTYHRTEMSTELETKLQELREEHSKQPNFVGVSKLIEQCIALASLPQQDVGAGRSVPSPVGQAPVAWTKEDLSAIITQADRIASIADGGALKVMAEKFTVPLFTHPPKAGALTDEEIERKFQRRRRDLADALVPFDEADKAASEYRAGMLFVRTHYLSPKP